MRNVFIKNKNTATALASICFIITIIGLTTKIYDPDPFILKMNILLPLTFLLTAFILPTIKKLSRK